MKRYSHWLVLLIALSLHLSTAQATPAGMCMKLPELSLVTGLVDNMSDHSETWLIATILPSDIINSIAICFKN